MKKELGKEVIGVSRALFLSIVLSITLLALASSVFLLPGCSKKLIDITGYAVKEGESQSAGAILLQSPAEKNAEAAAQKPANTAADQSCSDSDGGDEPTLAGKAVLTKGATKIIADDLCIENELRERYCEGAEQKMKKYSCKNGCKDGQCLLDENKNEKEEEQYIPIGVPVVVEYNPPFEEPKESENRTAKEGAGEFYNCFNGFKDSFETDIDCGGSCMAKCSYGKMCSENKDCAEGLKCNSRMKKCMQKAY